jgi:putative NADH-flavin reductase
VGRVGIAAMVPGHDHRYRWDLEWEGPGDQAKPGPGRIMQLTILAASGGTGLELTRQALERGHAVTAIARTPARIAVPDSAHLTRVAANVRDPDSIKAAVGGSGVVLSALGVPDGDPPGVLTDGARAVTQAHPQAIIWLGAIGTGPSAQAGG